MRISWAKNIRSLWIIFLWVKLANAYSPFTYPQPFSIYPQAHQLNLSTALEPAHSPQRQYHTSSLAIFP